MKIAVLSDIHGNFPALEAVAADIDRWGPDQVIVNGDIVNRGPCSPAVLAYVLEREQQDGWRLLRGNHESYLLTIGDQEVDQEGPEFDIGRFAYWTYEQLDGAVHHLEKMADSFTYFAPDGSEFRVVHGTMKSNRQGLYAEQSAAAFARGIAPAPAVFVTSHTHQAFLREVNESLVVNTGSAGAPFDLDWRPSYGRFEWAPAPGWRAEIQRVPYDRLLIEADYERSGFLAEAGPLAQLMLVELRKARGLMFRWAEQFEMAVLRGDISIEESVQRILLEEDVSPFLGPPGWSLQSLNKRRKNSRP